MKDFEQLTDEEQQEVIMQIGSKLDKQEMWYWMGLVHLLREQDRRIKKAREYIESIEKVDCRCFNYNRALEEMLISYEDLKKKAEEDGTLDGHFIEINKLKLLEILEGNDV